MGCLFVDLGHPKLAMGAHQIDRGFFAGEQGTYDFVDHANFYEWLEACGNTHLKGLQRAPETAALPADYPLGPIAARTDVWHSGPRPHARARPRTAHHTPFAGVGNTTETPQRPPVGGLQRATEPASRRLPDPSSRAAQLPHSLTGAMQISRRHLLALLAASAASVGLVGGSVAVRWWDVPAEAPFQHLSTAEATMVRAWSAAAFPAGPAAALDGGDAALDRFFDALLGALPATQRKLMKLLLHALDSAALPLAGGFFCGLGPTDARAVFHQLIEADLAEVRGATQGLTTLLGAGYTTHPTIAPQLAVLHRCGYMA